MFHFGQHVIQHIYMTVHVTYALQAIGKRSDIKYYNILSSQDLKLGPFYLNRHDMT